MTLFLPITRSQQMALLDVLMTYVRMAEPQSFVDVSTDTTTTTGELLTLVTNAKGKAPKVTMQMLIDAGLNGFALELLSESLAGKKDIKTFKPLRFEFRGVIYTLDPAKAAEPPVAGDAIYYPAPEVEL